MEKYRINLGLLTARYYSYNCQVSVLREYYIAQHSPNTVLNEENIVSGFTLLLKILL